MLKRIYLRFLRFLEIESTYRKVKVVPFSRIVEKALSITFF